MDNPELSELKKDDEAEREGYVNDVAETLRKKLELNNGLFQETLNIKPDGNFELEDEKGDLKSLFAHNAVSFGGSNSVEELYKLAYEVQRLDPGLSFTFERERDGQSITFMVRESKSPNKSS